MLEAICEQVLRMTVCMFRGVCVLGWVGCIGGGEWLSLFFCTNEISTPSVQRNCSVVLLAGVANFKAGVAPPPAWQQGKAAKSAAAKGANVPRLKIGQLTFGAPLGQGTYADVFEGTFQRNKVAVKVIDSPHPFPHTHVQAPYG